MHGSEGGVRKHDLETIYVSQCALLLPYLDIKLAHGRLERLPDLAAELVQFKPDVIVAAGNVGGLAAKQATSTIPIVVVASHDGVHVGLFASLARRESDGR
jgi:ABC-type uncharacterized transport system substrate-binding protein